MHNPIMAQLENFRLNVFRSVTERLNVHQAAGRLFLTQPAVTLQMKALKSDLVVRLFDRGRKGFLNATRFPFADVRQRSRGNAFRGEGQLCIAAAWTRRPLMDVAIDVAEDLTRPAAELQRVRSHREQRPGSNGGEMQ